MKIQKNKLEQRDDIIRLLECIEEISYGDIAINTLVAKASEILLELVDDDMIEDCQSEERINNLINESTEKFDEMFGKRNDNDNWCRFILPVVEKWSGATPEWLDKVREAAKRYKKTYTDAKEFLEDLKKDENLSREMDVNNLSVLCDNNQV